MVPLYPPKRPAAAGPALPLAALLSLLLPAAALGTDEWQYDVLHLKNGTVDLTETAPHRKDKTS